MSKVFHRYIREFEGVSFAVSEHTDGYWTWFCHGCGVKGCTNHEDDVRMGEMAADNQMREHAPHCPSKRQPKENA